MGQANNRGTYEQRKAQAIALGSAYLGKHIEHPQLGLGVIHEVRHDHVIARFSPGRRTISVKIPINNIVGSNR